MSDKDAMFLKLQTIVHASFFKIETKILKFFFKIKCLIFSSSYLEEVGECSKVLEFFVSIYLDLESQNSI